MELNLGLALPSNTVSGFDLNSSVDKPTKVGCSEQPIKHHRHNLHPCLSSISSNDSSCSSSNNNSRKRRRVDAFDDDITSDGVTLGLLLWNYQPNDEDDGSNQDSQDKFSFPYNRIEEDGDDGIVGWPPIKHRRKKIGRGTVMTNRTGNNGCADCNCRPSKSNYVKVKMDGVAIARKIDVNLYNSFHTLKDTLLSMFGISQKNSTGYKLTYQDREGDWLLADDVSWRNFIRSVHRLKLMKTARQVML